MSTIKKRLLICLVLMLGVGFVWSNDRLNRPSNRLITTAAIATITNNDTAVNDPITVNLDSNSIHTDRLQENRLVNKPHDTQSNTIDLSQANIDKVYVDKSEQRLYLMQGDSIVKSYHIALGDEPQGHKEREGDERTPEGSYTLDYKNENSIAYRSIHVSYPNQADKAHAEALGVSPGGAIMIHGQMNGAERFTDAMQLRNWTDGCMAVTNEEMDEIMDAVKVGTPIEIEW